MWGSLVIFGYWSHIVAEIFWKWSNFVSFFATKFGDLNTNWCIAYLYIRYLSRFFDCLAHPNLSATFATDEKWPLCHLRISYQSLAGSLSSLQKSEFLKLIISFFHYFWCQNWNQWHKMSGKNSHIFFFYYWFKNKRVWAEKIGKKQKKIQKL